jgi:hypothetical protein
LLAIYISWENAFRHFDLGPNSFLLKDLKVHHNFHTNRVLIATLGKTDNQTSLGTSLQMKTTDLHKYLSLFDLCDEKLIQNPL